MKEKLDELKARLMEVMDLENALSVLEWDQLTYMPPGGGPARGRQTALLARLVQEKAIDPANGRLLDELEPYAESLPYDHDDACLIRAARREYERLIKVPPEFMARLYAAQAESYQAWSVARAENDFPRMLPHLERILELSREYANYFPGYEHIADPLIDRRDYGMKASSLKALFAELRAAQVPLARAITSQPPADDACLRKHYPEADQLAFGKSVIQRLGYDFQRGRLDKTLHPFMIRFSLGDVRITTRVKEDDLGEALFSNIHEAGHAMYELNFRQDFEGSLLGNGASSGVHESSSRLWENLVGRSRGFWEYHYPLLQKTFPAQLGDVLLESFYRAINKVQNSLIRTEADEVTYNLHVMIRFDLELDLLDGKLALKDLPEAWHTRYQQDLGLRAPDDRDGVLQDVHWYAGEIGGSFQGYTLGNLIGAQFFATALRAHPDIPEQMRQGEFEVLRNWLTENVYQHGRKFTPSELVERATGTPLSIEPYMNYLKTKYGEIYQLA